MKGSATKSRENQPVQITLSQRTFHHAKHKMAALENYYHRAMTVLKDEEERKKEIQVVK